jgi:dTDP-4-dehydrorhamnose reductase
MFFHKKLINYCDDKNIKLLFVSSSNVFDTFTNYPSYENDKTFSESIFGRFKINIENKIDPSIIGGFILKIGDMQLDASVVNQLKSIKSKLTNTNTI